MPPRITIREVAQAAGVAVSTASMALRGHPDIAAETVVSVRTAASQIGYRKNPAFAALGAIGRGGRKRKLPGIGLITQSRPGEGGAPSLVEQALRQIGPRIGFRVESLHLRQPADLPAALDVMWARGCGALVLYVMSVERFWEGIDWSRFAVVHLQPEGERSPFCSVRHAVFEDLCEGWRYLRTRGYRRIGAVVPTLPNPSADDWYRYAALQAMQREDPRGSERVPPLRCSFAKLDAQLPRWLETRRPDAVIGFNSGVLQRIEMLRRSEAMPALLTLSRLPGRGYRHITGFDTGFDSLADAALSEAERLYFHSKFGEQGGQRTILVRFDFAERKTAPRVANVLRVASAGRLR